MAGLKGKHITALSLGKRRGCECGKQLVEFKECKSGHIRLASCTC